RLARIASPLSAFLPRRMRNLADAAIAMPVGRLKLRTVAGERRVGLLPGCVQQVTAPEIDEAVARLLARRGISLMPLRGAGCCGALAHHLGREKEAKGWARRIIEAFEHAGGSDQFQGILITATGCAAHIREYEHLFVGEPDWQARAKTFSAKLMELTRLLSSNPPSRGGWGEKIRVALQVPCSLQHGLRGDDGSEALHAAGFEVVAIPEGHLCCGSA